MALTPPPLPVITYHPLHFICFCSHRYLFLYFGRRRYTDAAVIPLFPLISNTTTVIESLFLFLRPCRGWIVNSEVKNNVLFRCVLASLYEVVSVGWSDGRSVGPKVRRCVGSSVRNPFFLKPKMSRFLYENHRGSPTLTLLNVLGVLSVLNVLNESCASCASCA